MDTIELPQGRVEYRAAGPAESTAPPVVFVHGLLVNNELWTHVADELARNGIRSYAPNLPLGSHSLALNPDAELSPRGVARLINDFLAALDLNDVTLVGNDTGGALCQFLIDADDSRIGQLVLTNCDAFDKFPPPPFGMIFALGRRPGGVKFLAQSVRPKFLRHSMLGFGGLVRKPLDPAMSRRWITPALTDAGVRHDTAKFLQHVKPKDLLDVSTRLGAFTKPTLLLWGNADRFFKIGFARRLEQTLGNATLVEVEGGRTFIALDEPERVATEIRSAFYSVS